MILIGDQTFLSLGDERRGEARESEEIQWSRIREAKK